ncbi:MAG: adenylosuccinate synthase [Chloroflexi bacterium]|nr:adenylosuccinate synthase [Chloroflexota bacterium]|tara:strand:+ start:18400 stop:19689 length:1290 start_codon:yes stop_codon:yes gene_type:complete
MPAYAVLGAQWGDEGKGKIVDFLSENIQLVGRFSGGNNAGHTVVNDDGEFSLHLIPSGIFWPNVFGVVGAGVVVDPDILISEIDYLIDKGIDITKKIMISQRAHIVMPYHIILDELMEKAKGNNAIGTTGKGIGPAYADKAYRLGIRMGDILNLDLFKSKLNEALPHINRIISNGYEAEPILIDKLIDKWFVWNNRLSMLIGNVEQKVNNALLNNENVLLEGAQGALLDLDLGTYPYVTSSNPTIGGAFTGLGINHKWISGVAGIFKAYTTRVGAGPLPSELDIESAKEIRNIANEFGTTTGRPRRIGWFDAVAGRYTYEINGYNSAILTRLDILDELKSLKICKSYKYGSEVLEDFPLDLSVLEKCEPIYEEVEGWSQSTYGITEYDDLPDNAKLYVSKIEEFIDCNIDIISTGPHRKNTIKRKPLIL